MADHDLRRILASLDDRCKARDDITALRVRAVALLALESGLRLSEALALRVDQVITDPRSNAVRIVSTLELEREQAKGRRARGTERGYSSAGAVPVPRRARAALAAYLREAKRREWFGVPWSGPLFRRVRGRGEGALGRSWGIRAAQVAWEDAQRRAGIARPYRMHDLRHTAITRWAAVTKGDPWQVAALARHSDVRTSLRYVHQSPERLAEIAERAAGRARRGAELEEDDDED